MRPNSLNPLFLLVTSRAQSYDFHFFKVTKLFKKITQVSKKVFSAFTDFEANCDIDIFATKSFDGKNFCAGTCRVAYALKVLYRNCNVKMKILEVQSSCKPKYLYESGKDFLET